MPKTLDFDVINETVIHVKGTVKISSDGPEISSIRLSDYAVAERPKPEIPHWPREFNIEPCKMDIKPESQISLKVYNKRIYYNGKAFFRFYLIN